MDEMKNNSGLEATGVSSENGSTVVERRDTEAERKRMEAYSGRLSVLFQSTNKKEG